MNQNKLALSAGCWIGSGELTNGEVLYFKKDFILKEMPQKTVLYCSGIGYQEPAINGVRTSDGVFAPAFSDYCKTVYYTSDNIASSLLKKGKNSLTVKVAEGWRNSFTALTKEALGGRELTYTGPSQLIAALEMTFAGGTIKKIATDIRWKVGLDPITYSSIFDGETFDASAEEIDYKPCVKVPAPGGELLPMDIPHIKVIKSYPATELINRGGGVYVADFGCNIAGNAGLKIPAGMKKGDKIVLRFAEELDEDGSLYMAPLRLAKCTDTYIASGKEDGSFIWRPSFTFHGFRYCDVTTPAPISKGDITAYVIHTDIKNGSLFSCGSALVNKIQENIVRTEENNIFSILTDCPQRDERMGWLNGATVRFEETPYNFDISRIFPKIVRDIRDCQGEDGSITCTAPFYFGSRPADPVCSSFLEAG